MEKIINLSPEDVKRIVHDWAVASHPNEFVAINDIKFNTKGSYGAAQFDGITVTVRPISTTPKYNLDRFPRRSRLQGR